MDRAITRRGILKLLPALSAAPFIPHIIKDGEVKSAAVKVTPRFYILFFDERALNVEALANEPIPLPDVEMELIPLKLFGGRTIEDAVRLYEVSGSDE
jgi:hypothetical protein